MSCTQTLAGIAKDCNANMGGIKTVYLANAADVSSLTESSGVITAVAMANSAVFYEYNFRPGTSSMSSNYSVSPENGTAYVETDLIMVFNRMESTKRLEITALAQGELVAIVVDNNGNKWYLGHDDPVTISAGDGLTGTARSDRNGYSITLRDTSAELPMQFTGSVPLT